MPIARGDGALSAWPKLSTTELRRLLLDIGAEINGNELPDDDAVWGLFARTLAKIQGLSSRAQHSLDPAQWPTFASTCFVH
ncbi:hypothetical protein WJX73_009332 [Symbiochloris irregularis]|uniref:Uncharacterized protein n=1 Tax=Symbiochloris irregularis TaxID=706552 RepID=A0AAW1NUU3_9CHLO